MHRKRPRSGGELGRFAYTSPKGRVSLFLLVRALARLRSLLGLIRIPAVAVLLLLASCPAGATILLAGIATLFALLALLAGMHVAIVLGHDLILSLGCR